MYVIATEMFWGRTDSNFNVRSPSFQLLWNYDAVTMDHAMSGNGWKVFKLHTVRPQFGSKWSYCMKSGVA